MFCVVYFKELNKEVLPIYKKIDVKKNNFSLIEDVNKMKENKYFKIGNKWFLKQKEEIVWKFQFEYYTYNIIPDDIGNLVLIYDHKQNLLKSFKNAQIIERNF